MGYYQLKLKIAMDARIKCKMTKAKMIKLTIELVILNKRTLI